MGVWSMYDDQYRKSTLETYNFLSRSTHQGTQLLMTCGRTWHTKVTTKKGAIRGDSPKIKWLG